MTIKIEETVVEIKEVVVTKAEKAMLIFNEESEKGVDKLRARVIDRFIKELDMGKPGSSTYFQNCKTKAAGEKVKHYYKAKGDKNLNTNVDNSTDVEPESFEVELTDETIKVFLSQQEKEDFIKANESIVKIDPVVEVEAA